MSCQSGLVYHSLGTGQSRRRSGPRRRHRRISGGFSPAWSENLLAVYCEDCPIFFACSFMALARYSANPFSMRSYRATKFGCSKYRSASPE